MTMNTFSPSVITALVAVVLGGLLLRWAWQQAAEVDRVASEPWTVADELQADREYKRALVEWQQSVELPMQPPRLVRDAALLRAIDNGTYTIPPDKAREVMAKIFPESPRWNRGPKEVA